MRRAKRGVRVAKDGRNVCWEQSQGISSDVRNQIRRKSVVAMANN